MRHKTVTLPLACTRFHTYTLILFRITDITNKLLRNVSLYKVIYYNKYHKYTKLQRLYSI